MFRTLLLFMVLQIVGMITTGTYYLSASTCTIPDEAQAVDTSVPEAIVIGDGTAQSCTSSAVVAAVAQGGIITFNCGPDPVTILMNETAKVVNNTGPEIVIDGGNLITLSGGGQRRILYMNTCDPDQIWTTPHCQNQDHPRLTVQNLTFADGNSIGEEYDGGGAIWVRGGRFKIVNCRFIRNLCDMVGPDVGGAAVRVFSQYEGEPVYVVNSVFGGAEGAGNIGSNGGGLSSIGVSFTVINSLFSHNEAVGNGGNPQDTGTPGGGSGGAIYNDGNTFNLRICGTAFHDNHANEYGGAVFFVSNNNTGQLFVEKSGLWNNYQSGWLTHSGGFSYKSHEDLPPVFTDTFRSDNQVIPPRTTIDINGDDKMGFAELLHALRVTTEMETETHSVYARKHGDIDYNHLIELADVISGLSHLTSDSAQ